MQLKKEEKRQRGRVIVEVRNRKILANCSEDCSARKLSQRCFPETPRRAPSFLAAAANFSTPGSYEFHLLFRVCTLPHRSIVVEETSRELIRYLEKVPSPFMGQTTRRSVRNKLQRSSDANFLRQCVSLASNTDFPFFFSR